MAQSDSSSKQDVMTTATLDAQSQRQMISDAQRGDRIAADRLVRDHDRWIRSVIFGVTGRADVVDDVAQQVWAQVFERLTSLENPDKLKAWLATIARNAALDASMAARRRRVLSGEAAADVADQTETRDRNPAVRVVGGELHALLMDAVQALPALYREPFVLRHLEGWSYAEIAAVLGIAAESVETRLVRARRLLKESLEGKLDA